MTAAASPVRESGTTTTPASAQPAGEGFDALLRESGCRLVAGDFSFALPPSARELPLLVRRLFRGVLTFDADLVDRGPTFVSPEGELPVSRLPRAKRMAELQADRDADAGAAGRLADRGIAWRDLLDHLDHLWHARREQMWRGTHLAEVYGRDALLAFLGQATTRANALEERYVGGLRGARDDEAVASVKAAIDELRALRAYLDFKALRNSDYLQSVLFGASWVASALSPAPAGVPGVFQQIEREIGATYDVAVAARATATLTYLAAVRRHAKEHPILLLLQHSLEPGEVWSDQDFTGHVEEALGRCHQSISYLREAVDVRRTAVPNLDDVRERLAAGRLGWRALSDRIAEAPALSVWHLPFFIDRMLPYMDGDAAKDAVTLREYAVEADFGERAADVLSTIGHIGGGVALHAAIPPVAVAIDIALGARDVLASAGAYKELRALYWASIDPATLLRGVDTEEPPTVLAIGVDLFFLLLDVVL